MEALVFKMTMITFPPFITLKNSGPSLLPSLKCSSMKVYQQ